VGDVPEQDESSVADKPDDPPDDEAARRRFVEDLVIRGEVVPAGTDPLPPGVTHEYVDDGEGGPPTVRRRRFSLDPEQGT
jgi:hypothetical protein